MRFVFVVALDESDGVLPMASAAVNDLSGAGHFVRLLCGNDANLAGLHRSLDDGPYDVCLWAGHAGKEGFLLADGSTFAPVELAQYLAMAQVLAAVLVGCNSNEHAMTIQSAVDCDLVVTVDPKGVGLTLAWSTLIYLIHELADGEDLRAACRRASANGAVQFRYIPGMERRPAHRDGRGRIASKLPARASLPGDVQVVDTRAGMKSSYSTPGEKSDVAELTKRVEALTEQVETLADTTAQLVRAFQGDTFTRQRGFMDRLDTLAAEFAEFKVADARWKAEMERRRPPVTLRALFFVMTAIVVSATALVMAMSRVLGGF